ncbi:MAG: poly(3-hydroxybutyrate) depolymerase [Acidobacteria bacterium OLB17]|nr:MAG: poly(3-hydroxybutyrate) depolymerase [Acidobacteria bacterium OLB17]MCZ2392012.1 polyhydroxybutyrate depolymerase [Acidobacteriota bacterium]
MFDRSTRIFILAILVMGLAAGISTLVLTAQTRRERIRNILRDRKQPAQRGTNAELRHLTVGDADRTYILHLPKGYKSGSKLPLVLVFHGGGGNAANMAGLTGFNEKADKENFIVVYPNGSNRFGTDKMLTWNAIGCCSYAANEKIDDVAFVSKLIDTMTRDYGVDSKRVYATGFSNGAMLSFRLGAELSDKIAAIAPVSGSIFADTPAPKSAVSVLMFNGTADQNVPYNGGKSINYTVLRAQNEDFTSAAASAEHFAKGNECGQRPATQKAVGGTKTVYSGCSEGTDVILYTIDGGGHTWPGGTRVKPGESSDAAINATDLIWDFFRSHRLAGGREPQRMRGQ